MKTLWVLVALFAGEGAGVQVLETGQRYETAEACYRAAVEQADAISIAFRKARPPVGERDFVTTPQLSCIPRVVDTP